MSFSSLLNQYIAQMNCTAKELSEKTGLSTATLSRYRSGERVPNSEQLHKLLTGISTLAQEKQIKGISPESIRTDFGAFMEKNAFDYERFTDNLNALILVLDISMSKLARALNFDPSYLSRIRLGQRNPSNYEELIDGICGYVTHTYNYDEKRMAIAELIGCHPNDILSESSCFSMLREWLGNGTATTQNYMNDFLTKLDEFNLEEYIRTIHFDELKVPPSAPFQLPTAKTYYGVEAMKQGELDFFKSTVLSKSTKPVFMCSDMPMEDMAKDLDFGKKWMFAIAMTLKKGLHLNIIHNIDRPFKEMMLGLESWIPLYMTGQVSPYYLTGTHNSVYNHFHYVSGQVALIGECIQGFHSEGKYYLTKNKEEVAYYQKKASRLFGKAKPLMEIYLRDSESTYHAFFNADAQTEGTRHNILSSLPVYTLPKKLLTDILKRHSVFETDGERLISFVNKQKALAKTVLQNNVILDNIPLLTPEEFEKHPMALSLSGAFYEKEIFYTYEEYTIHLEATKQFEKNHTNYHLELNNTHAFRNIQIQMHKGKWAMVSKTKTPTIHFVIRHSKMLNAFENFIAPVIEPED